MKTQQILNYQDNIKTIKIKNITISYIDEGKGEILLFIHGYLCDLSLYQFCYPYFKDHFRIIALDLPGAGYSEKPDINYTMTFFTEIVSELIEKLKIENVTLIGLSMGGLLAIKTYLSDPTKIKQMVLIDSAGMIRFNDMMRNNVLAEKSEETAKKQRIDHFKESAKFFFYSQGTGYETFVEILRRKTQEKDYEQLAVAQFRCFKNMTEDEAYIADQLHLIQCPVLILWGQNDNALPLSLGLMMHEGIKNSVFKTANECGHIMALEKPDFLSQNILEFLS